MNNKIRIKIKNENHYVIKQLYRKKINIYNIEYANTGNIYTIDEESLEKLIYEDIEILSYKGYKGFLKKLKRHRHFFISLGICICLMFFLSNIVINVEVIHSDKKIRELVTEELHINGIHPFIFKKDFNSIQKIKKKIKENHTDKLEWLEIIDEGMKYTVRIEERIITQEKENPEYCDLISTKDAIVTGVVSSTGQNQVFNNDFVKKGSTLVSGAIKFNEQVKSYTCASGSVYGNTWYTVNVSIPYDYDSKIYTNNKSYNLALESGSNFIEIFKVHFENYDTNKRKLFELGNFSLYLETHHEYKVHKNKYTKEDALKKAIEMGKEKILLNLESDAEILNEKVLQTNTYDSIIEVEIFYSVKEKISVQLEREIPKEEEGVKENEST